MNNSHMGKYAAGFGLSLVATVLLNALILVIKETSTPVMSAMKAALGHHWTTHGALLIIVFIVLGCLFSATRLADKLDSGKLLKYTFWAVVISVIIIAGFFLPGLTIAATIKY
mgnify:CR=1 FL=1